MISCLEFRRQLLVEPKKLSEPLTLHLGQCSECQQYYRGVMLQEQMIENAFAVAVPESGAAQVRLQQRFAEHRATPFQRLKRWWPLALAASVLLTLIWFPLPGADQRLARAALAHLEEDSGAWSPQTQAQDQLRGVLQRVSLDLQPAFSPSDLGQLGFAGNCVIDGKLAAHLVLHTPQGPVTLLLMPQQSVNSVVQLEQDGWKASFEPFAQGSMAVIARPEVDLAPYQQQVRRQVASVVL